MGLFCKGKESKSVLHKNVAKNTEKKNEIKRNREEKRRK
jgi:hypothetical protein